MTVTFRQSNVLSDITFLSCLLRHIGSVLFRASAFTGAKLASGVPAVIGHFGP